MTFQIHDEESDTFSGVLLMTVVATASRRIVKPWCEDGLEFGPWVVRTISMILVSIPNRLSNGTEHPKAWVDCGFAI